jgi:hypothetical protein
MLDEGLELLTKLWTGEPVLHEGRFYRYRGDFGPGRPEVSPTPLLPRPVQQPRIPIWVAGTWPKKKPFVRAARWDGVVPLSEGLTVDRVRELVAFVGSVRVSVEPFDVVLARHSASFDQVAPSGQAGATWWLEDISPWAFGWQWHGPWPFEALRARIRQGPPR